MNTTTAVVQQPRSNKLPPVRPVSRIKVTDRTIEGLTEIFKLLADKSRLKILLNLAQQGELQVILQRVMAGGGVLAAVSRVAFLMVVLAGEGGGYRHQ